MIRFFDRDYSEFSIGVSSNSQPNCLKTSIASLIPSGEFTSEIPEDCICFFNSACAVCIFSRSADGTQNSSGRRMSKTS